MSTISFTWTPDPAVHGAAIDRVMLALQNRTAPLLMASEIVQEDIEERFITETDPEGQPWEPWAESYKPVADAFPNKGILWQTGDLMEAATSSEAVRVSHDTVFYQTTLLPNYGLAHESGLPDRDHGLPQRAFLGLSDEAAALIYGHFGDWFDEAIAFYPTATGRIGRRHSLRDPSGAFMSRAA